MTGDQFRCNIANGVVPSVTSNIAALTIAGNYNTWALNYFTITEQTDASRSGPLAVYSHDGLPNLVKYALGLDPKQNATTGLPIVTMNATEWVYTYNRPSDRTDINYIVEVSTDLVHWSTQGVIHEFVSTSNGTDIWHARYPLASNPNVFFRLRIEQP